MPTPCDLCYGRSGTGKTRWYALLAEHIFKTTKKRTRWYIGDGGVDTLINSGMVDEGIIAVYQFSNHLNPMRTSKLITRGYWPVDVDDPTSAFEPPDLAKLSAEVGLVVFEGLGAMADYMMGYQTGGLSQQTGEMAKRRLAQGKTIDADSKIGGGLDAPFAITDADEVFGGVSMSGYGFIQRLMKTYIEQSRSLPVGRVGWTTHQRDADEEDTDAKICGPIVAGKALTSTIGAAFSNMLHFDTVTGRRDVKDAGKTVQVQDIAYRVYWKEHYDPDGRTTKKYCANSRAWPERLTLGPDRTKLEQGWMSPPDPVEFYRLIGLSKGGVHAPPNP